MRIVLNADDFGHSADTVRTTIECFEQGLLTSATIMPKMPATDEALAYARSRPDLSFGVHLTLVGDGLEAPISRPDVVPDLVTQEGRFPATRQVRMRAMLRRLPGDQLERELALQIEAVLGAGVAVSHVDSHRHIHKFSGVTYALERVLSQFGLRRVRNVQDVYLRPPFGSPTFWVGRLWRRRLMRRFATTDHFYMPTSAADRDWHRLCERLPALDGDTLEVGLHPGAADDWRRGETASLRPFVECATAAGHQLAGWAAIP
jgi:predicted glycoside hydrolase/deacetylase ChbG (UPF0249 family)